MGEGEGLGGGRHKGGKAMGGSQKPGCDEGDGRGGKLAKVRSIASQRGAGE